LPQQIDVLSNLRKKLKKNGKILIEVPSSNDILLSKFNIQKFKDFTFCIESLIWHNPKTLTKFLTKAGFKNYYFPKTTIIHYKGESTPKGESDYVRHFYNAMLLFADKHSQLILSKFFSKEPSFLTPQFQHAPKLLSTFSLHSLHFHISHLLLFNNKIYYMIRLVGTIKFILKTRFIKNE
jgi:hypothetical protein